MKKIETSTHVKNMYLVLRYSVCYSNVYFISMHVILRIIFSSEYRWNGISKKNHRFSVPFNFYYTFFLNVHHERIVSIRISLPTKLILVDFIQERRILQSPFHCLHGLVRVGVDVEPHVELKCGHVTHHGLAIPATGDLPDGGQRIHFRPGDRWPGRARAPANSL